MEKQIHLFPPQQAHHIDKQEAGKRSHHEDGQQIYGADGIVVTKAGVIGNGQDEEDSQDGSFSFFHDNDFMIY